MIQDVLDFEIIKNKFDLKKKFHSLGPEPFGISLI